MTDDAEHPTYLNPTIIEAVCQFDFEPPVDSGWQVGRPAAFLAAVSNEYPIMEPIPGPAVMIAIGPAGGVPQVVPHSSALKLTVDQRTRYLAVGDRHFTFGHTAPYPGWNEFRTFLLEGWNEFARIAKISQIARASLRYINVIPRTAQHPLVGDWMKATETVPEPLIRSQLDPFLLRLESWLDRNSLLIVTVGSAAASDPVPSILFDIQRTSTVPTPATSDELIRHINSMHDDVWKEFSSVRTERLKALLEGRST